MYSKSSSGKIRITRTIWILSLVSLFTDMASEMLYPVMPVYLREIGFSMFLIGILEGLAEAVAGMSKGYFGKLSDSKHRRVPFVRFGYTLSAISKPMLAAFTFPWWIFSARTLDRLGKGLRTGARDAILSDESTPATKASIFGFHRSFDTLGAVLGPAMALVFLYFLPERYRLLFLIALIPGIAAILFTLLLKERKTEHPDKQKRVSFFSFLRYWKSSPALYRKLTIGLLIFTLFNSSDVFLLLKIKESGLNDTAVIGVYIFYNIVYALLSYPLGILADKFGLRNILVLGLLIFASVYTGMAVNSSISGFIILFFAYGVYAGATEGISKAWISNIADKKDTATAIGTFTAFQSICALLASSMAGYIWLKAGAKVTFLLTAIITLVVALYLLIAFKKK